MNDNDFMVKENEVRAMIEKFKNTCSDFSVDFNDRLSDILFDIGYEEPGR